MVKKHKKLSDILVYILFHHKDKGGINETKLMKLLYFVDADYYEQHNETLSGIDYYKNKYGPTVDFKVYLKVCQELKGCIERQEEQLETGKKTTVRLLKDDHKSSLSLEQQEFIDGVMSKYGDLDTSQIVSISHLEPTYTGSGQLKDLIDFELVHHRQGGSLPDEVDGDCKAEIIDLTKEMTQQELARLNDRLK